MIITWGVRYAEAALLLLTQEYCFARRWLELVRDTGDWDDICLGRCRDVAGDNECCLMMKCVGWWWWRSEDCCFLTMMVRNCLDPNDSLRIKLSERVIWEINKIHTKPTCCCETLVVWNTHPSNWPMIYHFYWFYWHRVHLNNVLSLEIIIPLSFNIKYSGNLGKFLLFPSVEERRDWWRWYHRSQVSHLDQCNPVNVCQTPLAWPAVGRADIFPFYYYCRCLPSAPGTTDPGHLSPTPDSSTGQDTLTLDSQFEIYQTRISVACRFFN